jgi:protoporphyrinogen oxidase
VTPRVFVLGGGPCGLALAYELSQHNISVTVIEAAPSLGGLAQTISWGSSRMDLGPHKLFTLDEALMAKILGLRPKDAWIEHKKLSRIFMNGHYLNYPPTPIDLWKAFGTIACVGAAMDMALAKVRGVLSTTSSRTFEDDARSRVGEGLYRLFFKPLAAKIWGEPKTLDAALSKSRIQVPSVRAVIRKIFHPEKKSAWQANTYRYPRGGLSTIWETMEETIRSHQGEIILNDPLETLETSAQGHITGLKTKNGKSMNVNPENDWVISTIPISRLVQMLGPSVPERIRTKSTELRLNDLWLIFLKVKGTNTLHGNSWMFIPDPNIIFHRISTQRKFDPAMVEPDVDLLCCEVMNYPGKATDSMGEAAVTQACIHDVKKMGLIPNADVVLETRLVRLPNSYPVMTAGYQDAQKEVLEFFDQFKNLRTIGRQGAYNYIGTLDAMDTGFGAARWIIEGKNKGISWQEERDRTFFYPILD